MTNYPTFRLKVLRINQTCVFELSWGENQQIAATLNYPESLTTLYSDWQRAYLSYYRSDLRGRVEGAGTVAALPIDWHAKLVQAEAALNYEFHYWLLSAELNEISAEIASAAALLKQTTTLQEPKYVDVFLTCNTSELERLPWESWKIGARLGLSPLIRIVRTPVNIRHEPVKPRRGRPRILAILGDDTGLNFKDDWVAVRSLSRIADIEFVGWQLGEDKAELRTKIREAIASERGWDVLFFAGHSNETSLTGGELAIAPGVSMSISEISKELTLAKQQGLQFAIFNSCSGISIATSLIDLGLSQVAVMREPIHNKVAQAFLVRFLENLAAHKDVHEALLAACQALQLETNYPSAHLIPSLFCHPQAVLFRIKPSGIKEIIRQWMPTRYEAIALSPFLLLSLLPVQNLFLEPRLWVQAIYRDVTHQLPPDAPPPVLLVSIDEDSIRDAGMSSPYPMDREYLAKLVDKSSNFAKVIGLDYLLDRQQKGKDPLLAQSIRNGVDQGINFVFAADKKKGKESGVAKETNIANPNWSLQGYFNYVFGYVELLSTNTDCAESCPFAYLLTAVHVLNQQPFNNDVPKPSLRSKEDFRTQISNYIASKSNQNNALQLFQVQSAHLQPLGQNFQEFIKSVFPPLVDFSLPPNQVYESIPAWKFLKLSPTELKQLNLEQKIVIIAPGGYKEAGVDDFGEDNSDVPMAIGYWRDRFKLNNPEVFTGSEVHAYIIHHLLNQRLVVPIPDLLAIALVALLGKGVVLILKQQRQRRSWKVGLAIGTIVYGVIGLQVYISAAVLLPWLLPSVAFWLYVMPSFFRNKLRGYLA